MAAEADEVSCLVIGAGPAGVSAAAWLAGYDVDFRWIDRDGAIGGLLNRVHNPVDDFPPIAFDSGQDLVAHLARYIERAGVAEPESVGAVKMRRLRDQWLAELDDGTTLVCDFVILATGTRYRMLEVPGEAEGLGRCVSQSATADGHKYAGRHVAVVGGGDAAFENALVLADHGCHVHLLLRSVPKGRPSFVEQARSHPAIERHPIPTVVDWIEPLDEGCRLHLDVDGDEQTLEVACVFVRIGVNPVYPAIEPPPRCDADGFVQVDDAQQTSLDGLLAAGDVTDTKLRAVATAVGAGATAARVAGELLGQL